MTKYLILSLIYISVCIIVPHHSFASEKAPVCAKIWCGLGIGNHMFQYASAFAYAKKYNRNLELSGCFKQIDDVFSLRFKDMKTCSPIGREVVPVSDKDFFDSYSLMDNPGYNFFNGYFQDEKIFKVYRKELLDVFKFKHELMGENEIIEKKIKSQNSVAVHVRRGDYLNVFYQDVLSNHYYEKAMEYISSKVDNPYFYIFSDDTKWVKENLRVKYNYAIIENNSGWNVAANDMHLMSLCKHNIIANSTFSWWGAWLNQNPDKIVIAPKVWLSGKEHYEITKNIVPDEWVRIKEKADIAVVFNDDDISVYVENFDKYFLPYDRKEYFSKSKVNNLYSKKFDYVFFIKNSFLLEQEINYTIVQYDDNDVLYFARCKDKFCLTDSFMSDLISIKYPNTEEKLKIFIDNSMNN